MLQMTQLKLIISIFSLRQHWFFFFHSLQKQLHFASRKQKTIVSSLCSHTVIVL